VSGRSGAVQLVGRPGDELRLLATAARIEGRDVGAGP
jgi:Asp-tRNA(Asn)/Glu-tRNA(Gln) amidotransferase A subunit family amidase